MSTNLKARWLSTRLPPSESRRLVVLQGSRQTGKTTLARRAWPELRHLDLDAPDERSALRHLRTAAWARTVGDAILDEAQKEPSVFEKVKHAFDAGDIRFTALLGSSRILMLDRVRETLAGRAFLFDLWPLMLSELLADEPAALSRPLLGDLLDGAPLDRLFESQPAVLLGEEEDRRMSALEHLETWGGCRASSPWATRTAGTGSAPTRGRSWSGTWPTSPGCRTSTPSAPWSSW